MFCQNRADKLYRNVYCQNRAKDGTEMSPAKIGLNMLQKSANGCQTVAF